MLVLCSFFDLLAIESLDGLLVIIRRLLLPVVLVLLLFEV